MGLMRFHVQPLERITDEIVQQAYLSGIDGAAWPVRTSFENGMLLMHRTVSDSANLHLSWPLKGAGQLIFTSGTLMEQEAPYQLPLEIARGTVSQLLNQLFEWKSIGLVVPENLTALVEEVIRQMAAASVSQEDPVASAELSEIVLSTATEAAHQLAALYVEQALAIRRRGRKIKGFLGADLGMSLIDNYTAKRFLIAFNAANLPVRWRDVEALEGRYDWTVCDKQLEWCRSHGLQVSMGPLLLLDARALPDWLALWEGDFETLFNFFSDHVRAVVERYRGKVDMWQCAGRINSGEIFSLSEEEKLQLAARAIEIVRRCDPDAPAVVSFDQPWAEYMSRREADFTPLHFADVLIRSDLGLSGVMLELNMGYYPGGTLPRNPLEFSRQLDAWTAWDLPLWLSICAPSVCDADPMAYQETKVPAGTWTPDMQQAWVARYVPLMLAKSGVQGVLWNQLYDGQPHDFPYGGVFDLRGKPKPALRTLASLRQTLLK